MYLEDPFFNLNLTGRIGLGLLSLILLALVLYGAQKIYNRVGSGSWIFALPARLGVAVALLWAFEWLSPQVYYQYFRLIFEGLPQQIVIRPPPTASAIIDLLTFSDKQALSQHSRALLGWALIAMALATSWRRRGHAS